MATDHAPHAREDKDVPFEQAAMGTTGLETAFSALYTTLVAPGLFPLATLSTGCPPGPVLDLPVPTIAVGAEANLCLVDLQASGWSGRRLREPGGELLLRRPLASRAACSSPSPPAASPTASAPSRSDRPEAEAGPR